MGEIRYFYFWCEHCPTRITVETEVPPSAPNGEPEYSFAESEGVGLAEARPVTPTDDGLEVADLCPACGSPLHDVDDLTARGKIPRFDSDMRAIHAHWRTEINDMRAAHGNWQAKKR